jgi:site-specific recombinase XerD
MADETKIGTYWQDDELDAIVADYFAMLAAELSGQPYLKSRHSQVLMAQIGRTHRSVEFKHQNISAVMEQSDAWRMVQRRARDVGIPTAVSNHTFRATGITAYLDNGGSLENAQAMAAHESPRTTKLYDRTDDQITLDEVERSESRITPHGLQIHEA